jgi:hypothetical protein
MDAAPRQTVAPTDRWLHAAAAGLLAAVFAASVLGADRWQVPGLPASPDGGTALCMGRMLTGLPCPTCGMTRSFCALGRADLAEAVRRHSLGPLLYAAFAVMMVRSAAIAVSGRRWLDGTARVFIRALPLVAAAAVVVWVVRIAGMVADGEAGAAWGASPLRHLISLLSGP